MPHEPLTRLDQLKADEHARVTICDRIDHLLGEPMPLDPFDTYRTRKGATAASIKPAITVDESGRPTATVRAEKPPWGEPDDDSHNYERLAVRWTKDPTAPPRINREPSVFVDELDEWRATYGRLDIPVTVIDWRPVYAGTAALGIALVARWIVRHGR